MMDYLDRDVAENTREIRRMYSEARRRLGLPPRQFVTHVTLIADDTATRIDYDDHITSRASRDQHSHLQKEAQT
jgi:2'-5' RNA ligase